MALQIEPFVKQKFCILTININKTTMKTRVLLCLLLLTTSALWAQSEKVRRLKESEQINQLFEKYVKSGELTKSENEMLSPYWERLNDYQSQAQLRGPGNSGTPITQVAGYGRVVLTGLTYANLIGGTVISTDAGLTAGNSDDGYAHVTLPFTFNYNGTDFTQVTFSTNGWIAMGHITPTAAQGRTSGNLFTTTIPNNTIAAWFGDGNANFGVTGQGEMRHGLDGTDIYVFEWFQATGNGFSVSATNRINYQIRLYGPASATPGRIELLYGPTTATPTTGRSIGIENSVGGQETISTH
jgi:hypothetical protein